ncbi:DUF6541 family protein [Phycicoccus sp. Soil748]|uniref:DUF6541 family protein n=1 Tax=Phycicoccus sp. Soil748 TaxID=1736397 RepID=UPI000702A93B|nr:DUF6541 family protein [Phycicoccus sp. Soil748]KRE53808.1 hypothetical protein ASG70_11995 [Phycicoccus sp. Soil748]
MSAWLELLPVVLVAAGVLLVPGVAIAWAAGLRGTLALGVAAPLSVTTIAMTAVLAGRMGVPFGPVPVLAATTAGVALALASSGLGRRPWRAGQARPSRRTVRGVTRPAPATVAGVAGAAVGGLCAAAAVVRGVGDPARFPQTFDAVFHLNAVQRALESGNASSLWLGTVAAPERASVFYPAAWHDVVVLVVQASGAPLVAGVTAVSVIVAGVLWPLACTALAAEAFAGRTGTVVAAGVLSAAFGATPFLLLSYGTLWPNALATALLPGILACVLGVWRGGPIARAGAGIDAEVLAGARPVLGLPARKRVRPALVAAGTLPGLVLAHPNAVLSLLFYLTVLGAVAGLVWAARLRVSWRLRWVVAAAGLALLSAEAWLVAASPVFATTRRTSWPARQSLAQAAGEWLLSAPMRTPVPWLAAALVLVGAAAALRRRDHWWLLACHATAGALFVLVAGSDGRLARAVSGPWYDDPFRLAALLGLTAVPLAALGLECVVDAARGRCVERLRLPDGLSHGVLVALAAVLVAGVTGGAYAGANSRVVATWYGGHGLAGPAELALLQRLPRWVPRGQVVAGNPWNGSALASPVAGVPTLFPHLNGDWGTDRDLLAGHLEQAATDPSVCPAVERLHVGFVLDGTVAFWPGDRRQARYAGLSVEGVQGFEPVDSGGRLTLYRVVACEPRGSRPS